MEEISSTENVGQGRPLVAIVGRPNVGKSTFINRVLGRRIAIVEEKPGVTRDRKVVEAEWAGRIFDMIDTGGWIAAGSTLDDEVAKQSVRAVEEADLVVFMVDAAVGITPEDDALAKILRKRGKQTLVLVNKVDSAARESDIWAFAQLGFGDPLGVSALNGRGTGDVLDAIIEKFPPEEGEIETSPDELASVSIVGRPNVGKSTLFNRLIGDDRVIVHDMPGTTRDSIDTVVETAEGKIRFIDTAGMRRQAKVQESTEYYSTLRAERSIDSANATLLVIDAEVGVTAQDQRLAERIDAAGNPIVILLNKVDIVDSAKRKEIVAEIREKLNFVAYAPILEVSALTGRGVGKLLPLIAAAIDAYHRRIPTNELNKALGEIQATHASPDGRVLYATQGAVDPPTLTLFVNRRLHETYLRYIERSLRERFKLGPTPIKIRTKTRRD